MAPLGPRMRRRCSPETSVMRAAWGAAGAEERSRWREELARTLSPGPGASPFARPLVPAGGGPRAAGPGAEGPGAAGPVHRRPSPRPPATPAQAAGADVDWLGSPAARAPIGQSAICPEVPAGPEGCGRQRGGVGALAGGEGWGAAPCCGLGRLARGLMDCSSWGH